jgi:pimeloyl-ACP methyl ester carboxylesterase
VSESLHRSEDSATRHDNAQRGKHAATITYIAADGAYAEPAGQWDNHDWALDERDALIGRRRMRYLDVGVGETAVVLLHGMGGRWQHWVYVIPQWADRFRVLALDLPGFGESELPVRPLSLDGLADAVAELCRHVGVKRVAIVGHSMSGSIALRFASRHRELACAIVLVAGAVFQFSSLLSRRAVIPYFLRRPRASSAIVTEVASAAITLPKMVRRLIAGSALLRRIALWPYVLRPAELTSAAAALIVDGGGAPGVASTVRAIGQSEVLGSIDDVGCPILSIAGDRDLIAPLQDAETLQQQVPRARTVVLEECGHMPMLERPNALAEQLTDFVTTSAV